MAYLTETLRTPIVGEADIVVCGGGPAGTAAAITAARLGASVILVERCRYFGGQATGGLVIEFYGASDGPVFQWGRKIKAGVYEETVERLRKLGAAIRFPDVVVHPEYLKLVYQRMLLEAGVRVMLDTLVVGATLAGDKLEFIQIENKSGRGAIRGKVFVDATGDGDLAPWCGVPYELLPAAGLLPVTMVYRLGNVDMQRAQAFMESNKEAYAEIMRQAAAELGSALCWNPTTNAGEVWNCEAYLRAIDCTVAEDNTRAALWGQEAAATAVEFYRQHVPGFENATWVDTAPLMGNRESRRIRSRYWLTSEDLDADRYFEDTVVLNPNRIKGPGHFFAIPYRCLTPQAGPHNLIFAGRCIGVAHNIFDWVREIPSCTCIGQGAGTGAVLSLATGSDVADVEPARLKRALVQAGAIVEV